jgi:hypothetical protein
MQGDFSRRTFDRLDAYRAVLLQQGRVVLDADWNEQADITAHHDEARTLDVVGRAGGPLPERTGRPGPFAIVDPDGKAPNGTSWADLWVTPGTYYVDGILCESRPPGWPLTGQPHLPLLPEPPAAGKGDRYVLYLDVWSRQVTGDEDPTLIEAALGGPDTSTRAATVWQVRHKSLTAGQTCADLRAPGWLSPARRTMTAMLKEQPPGTDPCRISTAGGYRLLENQLYRVQVHDADAGTVVWSRDNASVHAIVTGLEIVDAAAKQAVLTLDRTGQDEESALRPGQLVELTSRDFELTGRPGYLARVGAPDELSLPVTWAGGVPADLAALGAAPIVRRWDGGPASMAGPVDIEGGIVVSLGTTGTARTGDYWQIPARTVQLAYGLTQRSGTIEWPPGNRGPQQQPPAGPEHHVTPLAIVTYDGAGWTLESDCRSLFPAITRLISLDLVGGDGQHCLPGRALDEPVRVTVRNMGRPVPGAPISVSVSANGTATTAGGVTATDPAHPPVTGDDGVLAVLWRPGPAGPRTQTMTLTRLGDRGEPVDVPVVVTAQLCRPQLRLVGGDGQTTTAAKSTVPLPISVVLDSCCGPVPEMRVSAKAGADGLVAVATPGKPTPPALGSPSTGTAGAETGKQGEAAFWWQPGFGNGSAATLTITVPGTDLPPIVVGAQLDRPSGRTPGLHVLTLTFSETKRPFDNDSRVGYADLVGGITTQLSGVILPGCIGWTGIEPKPVARVTLALPWPLGKEDAGVWSDAVVGFRTVILDGHCQAQGNLLLWFPSSNADTWLREKLWTVLSKHDWRRPLVGRFQIDGWAVLSAENPEVHLNGHAAAYLETLPGGDFRTRLTASDDEVTGGQFEQWFYLTEEAGDGDLKPVPMAAGRRPATAVRVIESAGLTVAGTTSEPSDERRKGLVLRTDPPAGTLLQPGAAVTVVVSSGRS